VLHNHYSVDKAGIREKREALAVELRAISFISCSTSFAMNLDD
jgi:hypothetical protein